MGKRTREAWNKYVDLHVESHRQQSYNDLLRFMVLPKDAINWLDKHATQTLLFVYEKQGYSEFSAHYFRLRLDSKHEIVYTCTDESYDLPDKLCHWFVDCAVGDDTTVTQLFESLDFDHPHLLKRTSGLLKNPKERRKEYFERVSHYLNKSQPNDLDWDMLTNCYKLPEQMVIGLWFFRTIFQVMDGSHDRKNNLKCNCTMHYDHESRSWRFGCLEKQQE